MIEIPNRFRREIQLHLLNNYSNGIKKNAPLILGIDGPPGVGKTFQCNEILKELNCNVISLSASDFGSMYEGVASNYIIEKYREAATNNKPVLVLNDIDTAIGDWGTLTQYTANRQLVLNELMHLCDFPESPHDIPTKRVPIIMTGNDFKKMYAPLIRFGRMKHFEWNPLYHEKIDIISNILYPLPPMLSEKVFIESEKYYSSQIKKKFSSTDKELNCFLPISFYSQLRMEIINDSLLKNLETFGWHQTYEKVSNIDYDLYKALISNNSLNDKFVLSISKKSIDRFIINSFV